MTTSLLGRKPLLGQRINWAHLLARGLVGCWIMNEGSGNKVYDLSGNGNHGTFVNTPEWVPSKDGIGINFVGTDSDYVSIPNFDPSNQGTVAFWIVPSVLDGVRRRLTGGHNAYEITIEISRRLENQLFNNTFGTETITNLEVDKLYHGVFTYDSFTDVSRSYVNGILEIDVLEAMSDPGGPFELRIGHRTGASGGYYDGVFLSMMIYNRVLTSSEVLDLYINPYAMFERRSPVSYFIPLAAGADVRRHIISAYTRINN